MARRKTQEQHEFNAEMGRRIERLRKEQKIQAIDLARMLGVSPQALYNYESGLSGVPARALPILARSLRVEVAELLPETQVLVESSPAVMKNV